MKKILLLFLACITLPWALKADVIVTGILDGTLSNGCPKAIELYIDGTEDLSDYRVERSSNGGAFGSAQTLSGTYTDEFVYLINNSSCGGTTNSFAFVFGASGDFANTWSNNVISGNGDDGFRIVEIASGNVIDQVWTNNTTDAYRDSYFYRNNGTGPDGGWVPANWAQPGNDALDGFSASQIAAAVPFGTYTPPVSCTTPEAEFSFSTNLLTVTFTDTSTNTPTSWFWDFGDGNTSTMQNPSHSYTTGTTYTVCLTVTNACGIDSSCSSVRVSAVACTDPTLNVGTTPRCDNGDFKFEVNFDENGATTGSYEVYNLAEDTVMATGTTSPITVTFPSNATTVPPFLYRVRHIVGTDTCISTGAQLISALGCPQPCSITSVGLASTPSCNGADFEFPVSFTVANGSGNYEVINTATNAVLGTGTNSPITAIISSSTSTTPINVTVRDANGSLNCSGNVISVTPQDCTPTPCGFTITPTASACDVNGNFDLSVEVTPIAPVSSSYSFIFDGITFSGNSGTNTFPFPGRTGDGSTLFFTAQDDTINANCVTNTQFIAPTCGVPLTVEAKASCSGANVNEYYVLVDTVYGGNGDGYSLRAMGISGTFMVPYADTAVLIGPFTHSVNGNVPVLLIATDTSGNADTLEVVEALCGYPQNQAFCDCDLGSIAAPGAIMVQSAPGSFVSGGTSGNTQVYALVDTTDGLIDSVNGTGLFTGVANGAYDVYAINYKDDITAGLDVDDPIQDILDGTMGAGPYDGLCYSVCPKATFTVDCIILDETIRVRDAIACDDGNIPGVFSIRQAQAGVTYELLTLAGDTLSPRVTVTNMDSVPANIDLVLPAAQVPAADTTSYQVEASVAGTGCSLILNVQPTYIPTPTPDLQLQGGINICAGASYNLITQALWDGSFAAEVFNWYDADPATGAASIGSATAFRGRPRAGNLLVSPMVTTDYWVIGSNRIGCADTLMFTIIVDEVPTLTATMDQVVCSGDMVNLPFTITPGAANILWANSNPNIGLGATGTGDISFTAGPNTSGMPMTGTVIAQVFNNGCPGIPDTFDITVNPAPDFATSLNDTVCSGDGANIDLLALNQNAMPGVTFTYDAPVLTAGLMASTSTQVIAFESFEGTAAELGYSVSNQFNDGGSDHYNRTDGSDIANSSGAYQSTDGTFFWAAEDTDDNGGDGLDEKTMTLNTVNIAGQSAVRVEGLFAAGNENGPGSSQYDKDDFFFVEYRVDGGAWQKGVQFSYVRVADDFNEPIALDTDFDGIGDGVLLNRNFAPFGFNVPSGNSLEIRVQLHMDGAGEEVAFDNIQVTATAGAGLPRATASADPIVDAYTNTSGMMQTATYKVVPVSAAGCEGDTIMVNLYVKPEPVLSGMNETICSGETSAIALSETSGMAGVTIQWDAYEALPFGTFGLNGSPSSGPGMMIADTYANLSPTPAVIPYEVTAMSAGGCMGEPDTVYLTVNGPQTPTAPTVLTACEDAPGSNQGIFDLTSLDASIGADVMWFNDNGMVTNPAAYQSGVGAVSGLSADNCGTTKIVLLQVETTPAMPNVDMLAIACNGNPAIIEPAAPAGGLIAKESFDGNGIGFLAPDAFSQGSQDHFNVTNGTNISNISGSYSGQDGQFFFAGEDINANGAPNERSVSLLPISIAGFTNVQFDGLFAAGNNRGPGSNAYDASDLFIVEYSVDGAPFQTGVRFSYVNNGDAFNEPLALDTNDDGNGDGALLTTTFSNYSFNIPDGNTVLIRVRVSMNSGSEEIAFDNLSVSGTPSGPANYTFYGDAALTQVLASSAASYAATAPDTVWVTTTTGNCESMAKMVIVEARSAAQVIAIGDTLVCTGSDCFLNVAVGTTGFSDYTWTGPNGFSATGAATSRTNLTVLDGGWYVLEATDAATGCPSIDSVLVDVRAPGYAGLAIRDTICVLMTDPIFNLRDSLNAGPRPADQGGVWAGPSALMNGDLGTFDPATMASGYYQYGVTVPQPCAICIKAHIYVKVVPTGPGLRLAALLEGPFAAANGLMRDDLRRQSLLPSTEPYTALGYTFVGGGNESVTTQVLSQTGPDAVVDWVVVELRDPNNPRTIMHSRSALMQRDGDIVDTDGRSTISFPTVFAAGTYHIVVIHRNHLAVMTNQAYTLSTPVDFTNGQVALYGGQIMKSIGGRETLMGGDGDGNGQVQNTDQIFHWMPQVGTSGYKTGDFNLNGQVQNTDRVYIWAPNSGRGSQVPK